MLSLVDIAGHLEAASGIGGYALVFGFAMIPGIEPVVVIPVAIGLGLDPIMTGGAALAGSLAAVATIVLAHERIAAWLDRRTDDEGKPSPTRYRRAKRLWNRYGLAGLAFVGPILAGIHLTALFAAVTGSDRTSILGWLTIGLGVWTVGLVVVSVTGFAIVGPS